MTADTLETIVAEMQARASVCNSITICEWADRLAALRQQQGQEWRPIAEAPRDGTFVLLWGPGWRGPDTGMWDAYHEEWTQQDCGLVPAPTHFRNLPAAPEEG